MKKRIVVLTGAGISAESGIATFRDAGGLWDKYRVTDVCTPGGWACDPELVTNFYNARRRETAEKRPCEAHRLVAALEEWYDVRVITQNIDNLHEQAGSTHVVHLHGELMKSTSSREPNDPRCIETIPPDRLDIHMGDLAPDGSQKRPFIVWFEEPVPLIEEAARLSATADIYIIIGTSLNVYPAAGLTQYVPDEAPVYLIDPAPVRWNALRSFHHIQKGASEGMRELLHLLRDASQL